MSRKTPFDSHLAPSRRRFLQGTGTAAGGLVANAFGAGNAGDVRCYCVCFAANLRDLERRSNKKAFVNH